MIIFISLLGFTAPCEITNDILKVGVEHTPPFAINSNETWEGISVDLWEKIAKDNNWQYTYTEDNFSNLLKDLADCKLDVVIPAVTISAERENIIDFSHPYLIEDIAIATNVNKSYWTACIEMLSHMVQPALTLLLALCASACVYMLLEKPKCSFGNYLDSFYWAITTLTTVGYGDEAPKTKLGKFGAALWMFTCVFITASILGQMISSMNSISLIPEIDELSDLRDQNVITIENSFTSYLLEQYEVKHITVKTEVEAINYLNNNTAFLVYDRSILEYYLNDDIKILERGYYEQHLAFALRPGLNKFEQTNISLIRNIESEWWKNIKFKYQSEK